MQLERNFEQRLASVRAADRELNFKGQTAYRNGQILAADDDLSNWDNYDRFFKFYNISRD
jgi:hypothetical protein